MLRSGFMQADAIWEGCPSHKHATDRRARQANQLKIGVARADSTDLTHAKGDIGQDALGRIVGSDRAENRIL